MVPHWREIYIEKLRAYYNEDGIAKRALQHESFLKRTPTNSVCDSMERTEENLQLLRIMHMLDNELISEDPIIKAERDRRERARRALKAIRVRWLLSNTVGP